MMLKFKKGGYARHDSGTVYKVKDIFPNKYNPQKRKNLLIIISQSISRPRGKVKCRRVTAGRECGYVGALGC